MSTVTPSKGTRNPLSIQRPMSPARYRGYRHPEIDISRFPAWSRSWCRPQPITTPHTTTWIIETSTHLSLHSTFTAPLVKPMFDPNLRPRPGTSLPPHLLTPQPNVVLTNSYHLRPTRIQRHTTQPLERRAPPHARARIRHKRSAIKQFLGRVRETTHRDRQCKSQPRDARPEKTFCTENGADRFGGDGGGSEHICRYYYQTSSSRRSTSTRQQTRCFRFVHPLCADAPSPSLPLRLPAMLLFPTKKRGKTWETHC